MSYFRHAIRVVGLFWIGFGSVGWAEQSAPPKGDWIGHGFTEAQRDEVRQVMQEGVDRKVISGGSLLLMHRGEVVFREAFGLADIETKRPFTVDDVCFIASLTKPLTATTLVRLEELGKISLDDPAENYIPAMKGIQLRRGGPARGKPLVRQGLSHTSGFPGNALLKKNLAETPAEDDTIGDWIDKMAARGLAVEPGTAYAYGRTGMCMAARCAEVASGLEFEALMKQLLLEPLGMEHTTFHPSADVLKRMPTAYNRTKDGLVPRDQTLAQKAQGQFTNAGGGLFSTLDDLSRFLAMHYNGGVDAAGKRVVGSEALAKTYEKQPGTVGRTGYGLGWNLLRLDNDGKTARLFSHIGGSGTMGWIDFDRQLAGVLLTQVPTSDRLGFNKRLTDVLNEIFVLVPPDATPTP